MKLEIRAKHLIPLRYIHELTKDIIFEMKDDKLEVYSYVDSAVMVLFSLEKSKFITYEKKENWFAIDMKELKPVLQKFSKSLDGIVTMKTEDNRFCIEFFERSYKFGILELEPEEKRTVPTKRVSPSMCIITPESLIDFVSDRFINEDMSIEFELKDDRLYLSFTEELKELKESIMTLSSTEMPENKSKYSKEYLLKMIYPLAEKIELEFEKNSFLRVTYLSEDFNLVYWLAPRVENT